MNQSYRVILRPSTNTGCTVSELAKAKGKSKSGKARRAKTLARIVTVGFCMMGADAALANAENTEETSIDSRLQVGCAVDEHTHRRLNTSSKNPCKDSARKTNQGKAATSLQEPGITSSTLGASAQARSATIAPAPDADSAVAEETANKQIPPTNSITPGTRSDAAGGDSISAGKAGSERQITHLAAGTTDTDAVNLGQVKQLVGDAGNQRYLKVDGKNDGSDDAVASGRFATAVGAGSTADAESATALGNNNHAVGAFSSTVGTANTATGADSTAIGSGNLASGENAFAGGYANQANGVNSIAMGYLSEAQAYRSIAIGDTARGLGQASTAIGSSAFGAGLNSIAIGTLTQAIGANSIAQGTLAAAFGTSSVAIGGVLLQGTTLSSTVASGEYSLALGAGGWALGDYSSAIGAGSHVSAQNSVALGAFSIADRDNAVSVGSSGNERQIMHVAAGTAATDAINKGQLDGLADSLSAASHYVAVSGKGDGSDDAQISGDYNVALGANSEAIGDHSTAIGAHAYASGLGSIALGGGAVATAGSDSEGNIAIGANAFALSLSGGGIAIGNDSFTDNNGIAIGTLSAALGTGSISLGASSVADGNQSIAIGGNYEFAPGEDPGVIEAAHAIGRNSIALGATARANGDNSVAIGPRAVANGEGSVALGLQSYADRDNTVSVGNNTIGSTRQITNVTAGTEDNDAVNLRQMNDAIGTVNGSLAGAMMYDDAGKQKMTLAGSGGSVIDNLADGAIAVGSKQAVNGSQLQQVGDSVAQMLGGGAMMGTNGFIGPVFGVQGGNYHNVGDALGALDGALDSLGNRVSSLENGGVPIVESTPKPLAKMARDVTPPATPPADPGAGTDSGKEIVTQDQLDDVKDYADTGDKQTLGSANQYTDRKVADKVSQSDFNEFKGNVDQRFDKVNKKISRVGAMASAMAGMAGAIAAAPANENRISAALGGYGGQTALSLGYAKRISNSGALLIGGSIASGGESSGTVGVSFGW